jgi:hypothetical protein
MNGLRILTAAGVAAAVACTSFAARADEAERGEHDHGLAVGLRVGYGIPFGNAQSGTSMDSVQHGMLPIGASAGWRFSPRVYLGAFYQYGVTFPRSNNCTFPTSVPSSLVGTATGQNGQSTCDGRDQRLGLEVQVHVLPHKLVDPWIGLGLGWEFSTLDYSTGAAAEASSFQQSGPEVNLQLGLDLRFLKAVPFGPYVDLSLAEFGTSSYYDANGVGQGPETFGSSLHGWVTFGLRVQFNL